MATSTKSETKYRLRVTASNDLGEHTFTGAWTLYEYEAFSRHYGLFGALTSEVVKWINSVQKVTGRPAGTTYARVELESETTTVVTVTNTAQALIAEHYTTKAFPQADGAWNEVEQ